MAPSRSRSPGAYAIVAVLLVACAAAAWRFASTAPSHTARAASSADVREPRPRRREPAPRDLPPAPEASNPPPAPPVQRAEETPRRTRRSPRAHSADPCRPALDPRVPDGYDALSAQGITVAWMPGEGAVKEPTAFAYLVAGLLEEAALVTGTTRRDQLMVIVHPSKQAFRQQSGAPRWADGLYERAVELPFESWGTFGVGLATLRHELMHAQLHTGAGCMPIWFNEGVAMQFADDPPQKGWVRMLRERRMVDMRTLEAPTIDDVPEGDVDVAYGQSLAMVLMLATGGEEALRIAVRQLDAARRNGAPEDALGVLTRSHPELGRLDLLEYLARRVFNLPLGRDLDAIFDEAVCCFGSSKLADFGCRGAPLRPGKTFWFDDTRRPYATCETDGS